MNKLPRLLSLDPAGLLWGSERALLDFIGRIPGFESACCCPPKLPLGAKLKECGVRCYPYFRANLHLGGTVGRLRALAGLMLAMHRYRPNVLHVNQAGATRIALMACKVFRVPCISHVRLREDVEYLSRLQSRYLCRIIAVSPAVAKLIEEFPALSHVPVTTLLDAYRSQPLTPQNDDAIGRQLPEWDLVCVGRFCQSKGQELLLRALRILMQKGIVPKTVFVGAINDHAKDLMKMVDEWGITGAVTFAGHTDNVLPIIARSRWLICASSFETLGRVLFEAWDVGVPVVTGEFSGGAASSVKMSGGGILYKEWTPDSLVEALHEALATDYATRVQLGANGRRWTVSSTDPGAYAAAMAALCEETIASFGSTKRQATLASR